MPYLDFSHTTELILPNLGKPLHIKTARPSFLGWSEHSRPKIMNNKPALSWKGKPSVAELVVSETLGEGWKGVWVYKPAWNENRAQGILACSGVEGGTWVNKSKFGGVMELSKPSYRRSLLPGHAADAVRSIYNQIKDKCGCWDVVAWKGEELLFVECKLVGKDSLKLSQLSFLEAGLQQGLSSEQFGIVEWNLG